jgi:ABC-2 type transport system permease protein
MSTDTRQHLIRAELTKLRTTRSTWGLGAVAIAFCVLWTVVTALVSSDLPDDKQIENIYQSAQQGYLFALIFGILGMSAEYRHQTVTWSFLLTPRRGRVLAAKAVAYGLVAGPILALTCVAATVATAIGILVAQDRPLVTGGVLPVLAGAALGTVLYTGLGLGLGALVRNQVGAIVIAFAWFYYAEFLLVWFLPAVGRWVPSGAAKALSGWHLETGSLLPAWAGGMVMLGYAALLGTAAIALTLRRDVT